MLNQLWVCVGVNSVGWPSFRPYKQTLHLMVLMSTLLTFLAGGRLEGMANVCVY